MRANRDASSAEPTNVAAVDAASAASFQPLNAHTIAGARRPSGRRSQRRGCMRSKVAHGASRAVPARYLQGVTEASGQDGLRRRHPTATVVIALGALIPMLGVVAVSIDARVLNPLLPVLLGGAAASSIMDVRFEGRLWVSGSFLC